MHLSLRAKFYLVVSILVFAVGGVLSMYFVRQLRDTVHQDLETRGRSLAKNLARNSEYGLLLHSRDILEGPIRSLLVDEMIQEVIITTDDGKPLIQSTRPRGTISESIEEKDNVTIASDPEHSNFVVTAPVYTYELPTLEGGLLDSSSAPIGRRNIGTVHMRASYAEAETAARRLRLAALGITASLVGVCLLLGLFLVRRIVNPLIALEAGTHNIAQGNLSFRVSETGRDEIGRLASSFNAMAEDLQGSRRDLDEINRNLEQKVKQKTRILSLAVQRLEQMNRLKSEFLANMSHELRTPLNAILGFADFMRDGKAGKVNKRQNTFLQTVSSSGQHLLNLINTILDLSKIEAGKMEVFREEFYVEDAVHFALSQLEPLAVRKKIHLHKAVAPEVKTVVADLTKVQQILQNLLSNAVKFTPENGRVEVVVTQDKDGVLFAVSDTGVGLSKEDQKKIFKAFTQVDHYYTRRFEGTGLGLSLVDHYVKMHRGRVWVESEPGKGSTFYVQLPHPKTTRSSAVGDSPFNTSVAETILVIDDDPTACSIMKQFLEPTGCKLYFAKNKEEARRAVRELPPSLITLDILLENETGWDLLIEIKGDPQTADIPVMIISAADERGVGCAFGADDYLVKPVDRQQLLRQLQTLGLADLEMDRQIQVLVIDDDPEARLLLRKIVEAENMKALEAGSGKEGIQAAQASVPDLIVLDLMMPEVNGFEVLRDLCASPATSKVPVIVVTAKDITPEDAKRLKGNVQAVFQKSSLSGAELIRAVRRVVDIQEQSQEVAHV